MELSRFRLNRLHFLAQRLEGNAQIEAYRNLLTELRRSSDVSLCTKILDETDAHVLMALTPDLTPDKIMAEMQEKTVLNNRRLEQLETELGRAKLTSNKESIRLAYVDIADLCYRTGKLSDAMRFLIKSRDYCTLPVHYGEQYLSMISLLIEMKDFKQASTYTTKASTLLELEKDEIFTSRVNVFKAVIALLSESRFKEVSISLLKLSGDGPFIQSIQRNAFILSVEEIALYASITAIATFDRKELKSLFIENQSFKAILESCPSVHSIILSFYRREYSQAFQSLEILKHDLLRDIYLHSHVEELLRMIVEKSILEYLTPYQTADLGVMNAIFGFSVDDSLVKLIEKGLLHARIDCASNTVSKRSEMPKRTLIQKVLQLTKSADQDVRRSILHLSLLEHSFSVSYREKENASVGRKDGGGQLDNEDADDDDEDKGDAESPSKLGAG